MEAFSMSLQVMQKLYSSRRIYISVYIFQHYILQYIFSIIFYTFFSIIFYIDFHHLLIKYFLGFYIRCK